MWPQRKNPKGTPGPALPTCPGARGRRKLARPDSRPEPVKGGFWTPTAVGSGSPTGRCPHTCRPRQHRRGGDRPLGTRLPGHHHERRAPREDLSCSPATLASRKLADGNGSGRHGAARCTRSTETKTKTPPPKGKEMYKQCRKEKGLDISTIRTLLNGERKM